MTAPAASASPRSAAGPTTPSVRPCSAPSMVLAVTVQLPGDPGAVNSPSVEMLPPVADQLTDGYILLPSPIRTTAVNCCWVPAAIGTAEGVMSSRAIPPGGITTIVTESARVVVATARTRKEPGVVARYQPSLLTRPPVADQVTDADALCPLGSQPRA